MKIEKGAKITSTKDVALLAGKKANLFAEKDSYTINNNVDAYSLSPIPLDDLDAESKLKQKNTIEVVADATVLSGGDILLYADGSEVQKVSAQAKGVNWISGLTNAVSDLFGFAEGGVGETNGKKTNTAEATITVAGKMETGLGRYREIIIDQLVLPSDSTNPPVATPDCFPEPSAVTIVLSQTITPDPVAIFKNSVLSASDIKTCSYRVESAHTQLLRDAIEQRDRNDASQEHKDYYQREVDRLTALMQKEGLQTSGDHSLTGSTANLVIPPLRASSGAIRILADERNYDQGKLVAPSDPSITIINKTFAYITTSELTIPEHNGGVFFNGELVTGRTTKPKILVDNQVNTTQLGEHFWPGIIVKKPIENLSGDVTLKNVSTSGGAIKIDGGSIRASSQTIDAGAFGIVDINVAEGQSTYETGGSASSQILPFTDGGQGTGSVLNEQDAVAALTKVSDKPSIQGARISIKANYINLNSLIESGRTDYTFEFTPEMETEAAGLPNGSKEKELTTNTNKAFSVVVNVDENGKREVVLGKFAPVGGYVSIEGNVASTGGGEIRVASGYSSVTIKGNSPFPIKLKDIDLSQRADGRLVINDSSTKRLTTYETYGDKVYKNGFTSGEALLLNSTDTFQPEIGLRYGFTVEKDTFKKSDKHYRDLWNNYKENGVTENSSTFKGEDNVDNSLVPILSTKGVYFFLDQANQGRNFLFNESAPREYNIESEIVGGKPTKDACGFWQQLFCKDDAVWTTTTKTGTVTYYDHSIRADRLINIKFSGSIEPKINVDWKGEVIVDGKIGNDLGVTTLKSDSKLTTTEQGLIQGRQIALQAPSVGSKDFPLRTNLADDLYFDYLTDNHISTEKQVDIYRGERVRVGDGHATGGTSGAVYEYQGDRPLVKQDLSKVNFGNVTLWKQVAEDIQMTVGTNADAHIHEINLYETSGDLVINQISARGDTRLRAARGIQSTGSGMIQIDPSTFSKTLPVLSLTADLGDIGTKNAPILISTTWKASVSATSNSGNVFLHSQKDLAVDQIQAAGDVVIKFDPGFTMLDVDFHDVIDQRTVEELTKNVWNDLQLTDTGFEDKVIDLVKDLEATRTSEYRSYWDLRMSAPSRYQLGTHVTLTPEEKNSLRPSLEQAWQDAGKSVPTLEEYVQDGFKRIEDQRNTWHTRWGSSLAYDREYKYTAQPAEKDQISASMHKWTEKELLDLRGTRFGASFLETRDTELVTEEPNIVGRNVTVSNGYGVGSYDHGKSILLKDPSGNRTTLKLDERAAVIAAESGDLIFLKQAPVQVVVSVKDKYKLTLEGYTKNEDFPYGEKAKWSDLGFAVNDPIMLEGDPGSTTDRGVYYKIKSISNDGTILEVHSKMTDDSIAPPVITNKIGNASLSASEEFGEYLVAPVITNAALAKYVRVLRREDVDINAQLRIDINATSHVFIGSEADMTLGNIEASNDAGTIQIKAGDNLKWIADGVISANRLLLESANGSIGSRPDIKPLVIGKHKEAILRAASDIYAKAQPSVSESIPLQVKNVYSGTGDIDLQFPGGFKDLCSSDVTVRGRNISLITNTSVGDITGASCPFTIEGKTIHAKAKDIVLKSTKDLIVGAQAASSGGGEGEILPAIEGLFASGNLRLESLGSLTILGTMSAGGEMFVAATGQFIAIPESKVLSNGPVTLVLHSLDGSSTPTKLDFLGQLIAPSTIIHGSEGQNDVRFVPAIGSSGEVQLAIENNDSMDYGTNWKAGKPTVKDGQFYHVLSSDAQKLLFKNSVRNTNPISPLDVTADGSIDPIDVLVVINLLNMSSRPAWLLSNGPLSNEDLASFAYYDVNADTRVDPLDVLTIINQLNRREGSGEGNAEGEDSAEGEFVANPGLAIASFTQFAYSSYGHDYFRGSRGNEMLFGRSSKDKQQGEGSHDQRIGGATENQGDLTSLDTALADWSGSDWSLALVDLGGAINDDDKDDVRGDKGIEIDSWLTADNLQ